MSEELGHTILSVIGTRPEAIKMAPVIRLLRAAPWARCRVVATAQHRELLDQALAFFAIAADRDLDLMRPRQTLSGLLSRSLVGLDEVLLDERPDLVLAQGDTTTVLAAALASFHRRIPFGHVEAGLRSGDLAAPFPEEANRLLATKLAQLHFAPTPRAGDHLLREGVPRERIFVTGNTVIEALHFAIAQRAELPIPLAPERRLILATAHRRDNFGEPMRQICRALARLVERFDDVEVLWPVHPNAAVRDVVCPALQRRPRVHLCEPLPYGSLATVLQRSYLVMTDSGGIMEEATALGRPVLVLRHETERPEVIDAGLGVLVGTQEETIVAQATKLLCDADLHARVSVASAVYGDGRAAARIVEACRDFVQASTVRSRAA